MAKNKIKRDIKWLRRVRVWQLVILLILMMFATATFMRMDNIGMAVRRAAVISADEAGDKEKLDESLVQLKEYVFSHMNSSTGKFYLEHQYKRDFDAAMTAAGDRAAASNPNGNIYKKAAKVCDPKYSMYSPPYLSCILNELSKYPPTDNYVETFEPPNTELYRLNYVSPVWTFSFAGVSALVCVLIVVAMVIRIVALLVLKIALFGYRNS